MIFLALANIYYHFSRWIGPAKKVIVDKASALKKVTNTHDHQHVFFTLVVMIMHF